MCLLRILVVHISIQSESGKQLFQYIFVVQTFIDEFIKKYFERKIEGKRRKERPRKAFSAQIKDKVKVSSY